jgi:hypothetical protein
MANNYGITAATSAKYHGMLDSGLNDLTSYVSGRKGMDEHMLARSPYESNVYALVEGASKGLSSALSNYTPEGLAAVNPSPNLVKMPQDTIRSEPAAKSPFIAGTNPGERGYQAPEARLGAPPASEPEMSVYPKATSAELPAAPATEKGTAVGPFTWPAKSPAVSPAQLGQKQSLPPTGKEEEMAPWQMADDGKTASRISKLNKLAQVAGPATNASDDIKGLITTAQGLVKGLEGLSAKVSKPAASVDTSLFTDRK